MQIWRSTSTFQTRGVAPTTGGPTVDFAFAPTSIATYGDLLLDMPPGETRWFAPLDEVGVRPPRFVRISERSDVRDASATRSWADPICEAAVLRGGGGVGWRALGRVVPRLQIRCSLDSRRARLDPFPVVSSAFRAVVDRLDPAAALFHPIDLRLEDGGPAPGAWFLFDIVRVRQIVDLTRFRGALAHTHGALRLASRSYVFDERPLGPGVHFIRDPLLANVELASREACEAFQAAGIEDLAFDPVNRRDF